MDDSIKYINIEDLIPGEFQAHFENTTDNLDNLANSIKKNGIIVPLVVREKQPQQYEIILGNRRYNAAKIAGLKQVPVIIIEANDEKALDIVISDNVQRRELTAKEEAYLYDKDLEYTNNEKNLSDKLGIPIDRIISKLSFIRKNVDNKNSTTPNNNINNNINNSINNNISNNSSINQDIINLSDLNKEEEREDFNMNNDIINNQNLNTAPTPNNPQQQTTQEPTFGGRFFPSLEDEPTNMDMNQNISAFSNSNINNQNQQSLIDLTDTTPNNNTSQTNMNNNNVEVETMNNTNQTDNNIGIGINYNEPINQETPQMNNFDNNIQSNMNNIQNNENTVNNGINDIQQEQPNVPNLDALSTNIVDNVEEQPQQQIDNMNEQPQDINNNIGSNIDNTIQSDFSTPQESNEINNQEQIIENNINNNEEQPELTSTSELEDNNINTNNQTFSEGQTELPSKDIIPVVNMIKSLAVNIENLGYKLNITENENETSYTINIEVDK